MMKLPQDRYWGAETGIEDLQAWALHRLEATKLNSTSPVRSGSVTSFG